ncbi:phosphatidylinositol alpha-1,6-mannosyltransferase [Pedobacter sp. W3I1]|uniref:glycosyltransferase family 4 protein n=1 Tax=Pedobacter sp. W3I1 TaxID=3042291 RepID=UPI0027842B11|nr:glycosyltransferase family 4 protein [Pedobacter sp. W3I1]MDQ0640894.1 phosphatidylinositol alpha-1,6-mannosyltransferase [Pedobacter sp. W3I1]
MKDKKVLFLTLHTFNLTGGIEKVSKTFAKTLDDLKAGSQIQSYQVLSMYDDQPDLAYVSQSSFKGYNGKKLAFGLAAIKAGLKADVVVLSHVHLLLFARIIKTLKPNIRIVLFAHGIEIWNSLASWKKQMLNKIEIWAVSRYTADQIIQQHGIASAQIKILNNCLDPYFKLSESFLKPASLLSRYGVRDNQKVLLSICRLSSSEQYKGYDLVIECLEQVIKVYPDLVYLLVGKADRAESARIQKLIAQANLKKNVILTGFVPEHELALHYQLADAFVMPSKAEGFGLVFIEAAAYGCAVIGGDADGSRDALLDGELGTLLDPNDIVAIGEAIIMALQKEKHEAKAIQDMCFETFGYQKYREKILTLLFN